MAIERSTIDSHVNCTPYKGKIIQLRLLICLFQYSIPQELYLAFFAAFCSKFQFVLSMQFLMQILWMDSECNRHQYTIIDRIGQMCLKLPICHNSILMRPCTSLFIYLIFDIFQNWKNYKHLYCTWFIQNKEIILHLN